MTDELKNIMELLAEPFDADEVKFRPGGTSGNRAMALAYVDARVIQDRLDDVLGVDGWQDDYECLADGSVVCRLRLRINGEWLTKVDVGSPSEQPDPGDKLKAAFSDALKRAAVKFGMGRYLYRLPSQWVDYDPQKRRFAKTPTLPAWAMPRPKPARQPEPEAEDEHDLESLETRPPEPLIDQNDARALAKECETNHVAPALIREMLRSEYQVARLSQLPAGSYTAVKVWIYQHRNTNTKPEAQPA